MSNRYNLDNFEADFRKYLIFDKVSATTLKNYLSDLRHFFAWSLFYIESNQIRIDSTGSIAYLAFITTQHLDEYKTYLANNKVPVKTINRRLSTMRKFCSFCVRQEWMKGNPAKQVINSGGIIKSNEETASDDVFLRYCDHLKQHVTNTEEYEQNINDVKEFLSIIQHQ